MKIAFCTKGDRLLPSSRTRAHLVADHLRRKGYDAASYQITTRPWWNISYSRCRDIIRSVRLLYSLKKKDVLYIHKPTDQLDFMFLVLLRKWILRRGYILDFDDAIFLGSRRRAAKACLMVLNADTVVVGSHFLLEYALQYNRNSHVLSAPIDTEDTYVPVELRVSESRTRIGWTGTSGHYENMKLLVSPLARLVDENHKIVFVQLGGGDKIHELFANVRGLAVEYIATLPWDNPHQVVRHMQQFDIGVMPLQKTEFNRGKDGWKAKEYMGCGVATVLSNWGENPYIVRNGVDGLLVDDNEWYSALKRLIKDAQYRRLIGDSGRARMQAEFSYSAFTPRLLDLMGIAENPEDK